LDQALLEIIPAAKGGHWALTPDSDAVSHRMRQTISVSQDGETNMDFSTREAFAVREFCARYGICRQTFYDELKRGRIKAKKLGKKTVILRSDAENWASSLPALNLAVAARS